MLPAPPKTHARFGRRVYDQESVAREGGGAAAGGGDARVDAAGRIALS